MIDGMNPTTSKFFNAQTAFDTMLFLDSGPPRLKVWDWV